MQLENVYFKDIIMDNNPLKQYFRRPAVHMRLPSGGAGYDIDTLDMPESGELPVYPMTAIDEITVRTPDALFNGSAVADLIRSCVPSIKDPWSVSNIDLDAILVAIKAASSPSGNMDIDSTCPKCEDISTFSINLANVLGSIGRPDYSKELEVGELKIKFKPLKYKEVNEASLQQFEFQRITERLNATEDDNEKSKLIEESLKRVTDLTMELLSKSIEHIQIVNSSQVTELEYILDFLRNCDRNTYAMIRDYSASLRAESEIKPMKMICASCNHEYEQSITLNPSDFFE